jgi:hypothetical protein
MVASNWGGIPMSFNHKPTEPIGDIYKYDDTRAFQKSGRDQGGDRGAGLNQPGCISGEIHAWTLFPNPALAGRLKK